MKSLSFAVLFAASAVYAAPPKASMVTPDGLTWTAPFGDAGPKFAKVSGDEKKGPYTFFLKMAAGSESGWHTHDADYSAVVIQGVAHNIEQGGEDKPMPAGSAWTQPAKGNHMNKCDPGTDCIVYIHQLKGFSFKPMTADGKPAPAAPPPAKDAKKEEPKK